MIRFNQQGEFNVPFCRKPNRFAQAYITKICNQVQVVSDACALGDYEFRCQDYSVTIAEATACDLLYCDPPHTSNVILITLTAGMRSTKENWRNFLRILQLGSSFQLGTAMNIERTSLLTLSGQDTTF